MLTYKLQTIPSYLHLVYAIVNSPLLNFSNSRLLFLLFLFPIKLMLCYQAPHVSNSLIPFIFNSLQLLRVVNDIFHGDFPSIMRSFPYNYLRMRKECQLLSVLFTDVPLLLCLSSFHDLPGPVADAYLQRPGFIQMKVRITAVPALAQTSCSAFPWFKNRAVLLGPDVSFRVGCI